MAKWQIADAKGGIEDEDENEDDLVVPAPVTILQRLCRKVLCLAV